MIVLVLTFGKERFGAADRFDADIMSPASFAEAMVANTESVGRGEDSSFSTIRENEEFSFSSSKVAAAISTDVSMALLILNSLEVWFEAMFKVFSEVVSFKED